MLLLLILILMLLLSVFAPPVVVDVDVVVVAVLLAVVVDVGVEDPWDDSGVVESGGAVAAGPDGVGPPLPPPVFDLVFGFNLDFGGMFVM